MSIATTTGDTGETSLAGGTRVSKGAARVEAYGTVDELIAHIGLARALCRHGTAGAIAREIQSDLFGVAESLARDGAPLEIDPARVENITARVHEIEQLEGVLIDWAVPGDDVGGAAFDVARTVCRRAERTAVRLRGAGEQVHPTVLAYLNRAADLLWLLGRLVERDGGVRAALRRQEDGGGRWSKAW
jgi:cob(I)alamin adenosyltransferase